MTKNKTQKKEKKKTDILDRKSINDSKNEKIDWSKPQDISRRTCRGSRFHISDLVVVVVVDPRNDLTSYTPGSGLPDSVSDPPTLGR